MPVDEMSQDERRLRELEATDKKLDKRIRELEKLIQRLATFVGASRQMTEAP
jgi:hypothetical protein